MRQSKYGAKPTVVDNIRFASQKEARRYQELRLLERARKIKNVECQYVFTLEAPVNSVKGRLENAARRLQGKPSVNPRIGKYIADFAYYDLETRMMVYEDVKGFRTPMYRWKKKHVEAQYGIEIREV